MSTSEPLHPPASSTDHKPVHDSTNGEEETRSDGLTVIRSQSKGGLFRAPPWTATTPLPHLQNAVLECYKQEGVIMKHLRMGKQVTNLFGRNEELCDHCVQHPSISRQHAVLVHTTSPQSPFVIVDLYSSHGTFVGDQKLQPGHPRPLKDNDVIRFGASTRKYKVKGTSSSSSSSSSTSASKSTSKDSSQSSKPAPNERDRKRPREDENKDTSTSSTTASSSSSDSRPKKKPSGEKVRARHILVKHVGSRRPSSHKSEHITRTAEEAMNMIKSLRKRVTEGGESFAKLAETESDCSSYKRGGDLGPFTREMMQPSFSSAAFALQIGEVSEPVITESGVHIIQRIDMN